MSCQLKLFSHLERESGFRKFLLLEPGIWSLCFWNPESWALESPIQFKKFGIPPTIGIRNPSSTDKNLEPSDWNPGSTAWDTESKTVSDSLTWGDCFLNSGWRLIELFVVETQSSVSCGGYFLVIAWWECAVGWSRISTTGLCIFSRVTRLSLGPTCVPGSSRDI